MGPTRLHMPTMPQKIPEVPFLSSSNIYFSYDFPKTKLHRATLCPVSSLNSLILGQLPHFPLLFQRMSYSYHIFPSFFPFFPLGWDQLSVFVPFLHASSIPKLVYTMLYAKIYSIATFIYIFF